MKLEPREFEEVTIYTTGNVIWDNIIRVDAARARVWVAPYAQHHESVHLEFVRKGKRKGEYMVCSADPYAVVVPTEYAIEPDDLYLPAVDGVASTRYGVGDPRWRTDFNKKLLDANVPILADFRKVSSSGAASQEEPLPGAFAGVLPTKSPDHNEGQGVPPEESEYEGLRKQREHFFFERNPRLVIQAKEVYGCRCQACGFDFAQAYGALGFDFAEVHHLNPLSERPSEEWTSAVQTNISDVAILCANCHRMVHRRKPAVSINELTSLLAANLCR